MKPIILDKNVTLKSKGLYLTIEALKENNIEFTQAELCEMCSNGLKAILSGLAELKEKGYLEIKKVNMDGKFIYKYILLK